MRRNRLHSSSSSGGAYFTNRVQVDCIPSGCVLLDCVLGGGWAVGRIANIVGDKSSGKTLLVIEACANFAVKYPEGVIWYGEVEAAFDKDYAEHLGLPVERVRFIERRSPEGRPRKDIDDRNLETVEDLFEHASEAIEEAQGRPSLYILDSLDALTDRAEKAREIDKGSYGAAKAKQMSQLFRRLVRMLEQAKFTLLIISQVRDNIGVTFGKTTTRSGGRALDFYASQVVWLSQIKRIKRTRRAVERVTGIMVRAKCEKNKVGLPFREAEFPLLFTFGVDDAAASVEWLRSMKALDRIDLSETRLPGYLKDVAAMTATEYRQEQERLGKAVRKLWREVEQDFLPKRKKYG